MTLGELIEWHVIQRENAQSWVTKHNTMNKHGRAYHDAQAAKHQKVVEVCTATLAILNKHAGAE